MSYPLSSIFTSQSSYKKPQRVAQYCLAQYYGNAAIIAMMGLTLMLSACQKSPDIQAEPTAESNAITIDNNTQNAAVVNEPNLEPSNNISANQAQNSTSTPLENAPTNGTDITPNPETMPLSNQQPRGTQVTDVHYRSAEGETLTVVFQTSATGILNAVITLSNDTKMTLSAPEGQGNNPTYRSVDGKIELVSHQGGTVIDLIRNNTVTSFTATSAEAEVITQT